MRLHGSHHSQHAEGDLFPSQGNDEGVEEGDTESFASGFHGALAPLLRSEDRSDDDGGGGEALGASDSSSAESTPGGAGEGSNRVRCSSNATIRPEDLDNRADALDAHVDGVGNVGMPSDELAHVDVGAGVGLAADAESHASEVVSLMSPGGAPKLDNHELDMLEGTLSLSVSNSRSTVEGCGIVASTLTCLCTQLYACYTIHYFACVQTELVTARMIPFDSMFMLAAETPITHSLLITIADTAHSRIPVYRNGDRNSIAGVCVRLLVPLHWCVCVCVCCGQWLLHLVCKNLTQIASWFMIAAAAAS